MRFCRKIHHVYDVNVVKELLYLISCVSFNIITIINLSLDDGKIDSLYRYLSEIIIRDRESGRGESL